MEDGYRQLEGSGVISQCELWSCSDGVRQNAFSHKRNCTRISSSATSASNQSVRLAERHEEPGCPFMSH